MKRRQFLLAGGALVMAAMLFILASVAENKTGDAIKDAKDRRPDPDMIEYPILKALTLWVKCT
jgi:hypothetical protein